jgi:UDP-glucose 4-epimerase
VRRAVVTGCAGFIGSHLTERLLADGWHVTGIDRFSDYYPRPLKERNLVAALSAGAFELIETDLADAGLDASLEGTDVVFHLAAQAGVRASWGEVFDVYARDNVLASQRVLEACMRLQVPRVVCASSSSVYGNTRQLPMTEDALPRPYSPYGVTKLAAEHLCALYADNFGLPTVALRYFTVFGPRQRPDMGLHRFLLACEEGRTVQIYGDGSQTRDFTYIDDVIDATVAAASLGTPGSVYNIGGGHRRKLADVLDAVERVVGKELAREYVDTQRGDVSDTSADVTRAREDLGFAPHADFEKGLELQLAEILDRRELLRPL